MIIFRNIHSTQKDIWKVVKSLSFKENNLPTLMSGTITATSNTDKAPLLNVMFANNFNYSISGVTGDLPDITNDVCPSDFLRTEDEVYDLLSTLDVTTGNGPDDISTRMLKRRG